MDPVSSASRKFQSIPISKLRLDPDNDREVPFDSIEGFIDVLENLERYGDRIWKRGEPTFFNKASIPDIANTLLDALINQPNLSQAQKDTLEHIVNLAAAMESPSGLQYPVLVVEDRPGTNQPYLVFDGNCRTLALALLGAETVPALFPDPEDIDNHELRSAEANLQRQDLSTYGFIKALRKILKAKGLMDKPIESERKFAAEIGLPRQTARRAIAVLQKPQSSHLFAAMKEGKITSLRQAEAAAKLSENALLQKFPLESGHQQPLTAPEHSTEPSKSRPWERVTKLGGTTKELHLIKAHVARHARSHHKLGLISEQRFEEMARGIPTAAKSALQAWENELNRAALEGDKAIPIDQDDLERFLKDILEN